MGIGQDKQTKGKEPKRRHKTWRSAHSHTPESHKDTKLEL